MAPGGKEAATVYGFESDFLQKNPTLFQTPKLHGVKFK